MNHKTEITWFTIKIYNQKRREIWICDFVQVSYKSVNQDFAEWRFSFSRAELIIISRWTAYWRAKKSKKNQYLQCYLVGNVPGGL